MYMTQNKWVINVQIGIMVVSLCKNPQDETPALWENFKLHCLTLNRYHNNVFTRINCSPPCNHSTKTNPVVLAAFWLVISGVFKGSTLNQQIVMVIRWPTVHLFGQIMLWFVDQNHFCHGLLLIYYLDYYRCPVGDDREYFHFGPIWRHMTLGRLIWVHYTSNPIGTIVIYLQLKYFVFFDAMGLLILEHETFSAVCLIMNERKGSKSI